MDNSDQKLEVFQELVVIKYQIYNALFLLLPFENLSRIGVELPFFAEYCHDELLKDQSPKEIVRKFFNNIMHSQDTATQIPFLFLILQFVERQVLLLDAVEDAAFTEIHDPRQYGTLEHWIYRITSFHKLADAYQLLQSYRMRVVLTAHPTQFYPPEVLEILSNLSPAIKDNNLRRIRELLLQLGRTSFKNTHQPSPIDEANVIIDYLERIFYPVIIQLQCRLHMTFVKLIPGDEYLPTVLELGFWPGGDRDGNPNITPEITMQVARKLKARILSLYTREIDNLKRDFTFPNLWEKLDTIKNRLRATQKINISEVSTDAKPYLINDEFISELQQLKQIINRQHGGLFIEKLDRVIIAALTFKFYFASIDLRQNSRVHTAVLQKLFSKNNWPGMKYKSILSDYKNVSHAEKKTWLIDLLAVPSLELPMKDSLSDSLSLDVIGSLKVAKEIQITNGEMGLHRYIISNTQAAYNILEVILLAKIAGWSLTELTLDIVPLFETIHDLMQAKTIMQELFQIPIYRDHIFRRSNRQYIMLGYSDSSKDGSYFTANWSILQCKEDLSALANELGIEVIFFDGRGGPPARGGANTEKFYRANERMFRQTQVQTTIQGQTISAKFGTEESATFNLEQLFTQVLSVRLFNKNPFQFTTNELSTLQSLATISYDTYQELKQDPQFITYLEQVTPLRYFGDLNIASRPPTRSDNSLLQFSDLRAIPFVGSWAQIKQNIPGYYGLGTALAMLVTQGKEQTLKVLYHRSLYFRTLLENAMQSLLKTNFLLTAYLRQNPTFGALWQKLNTETKLCVSMLKLVSGQDELLANDPIVRNSIIMRENLVLPLLVIQQYAMMELYKSPEKTKLDIDTIKVLKKLILKSVAANVNASRNSA